MIRDLRANLQHLSLFTYVRHRSLECPVIFRGRDEALLHLRDERHHRASVAGRPRRVEAGHRRVLLGMRTVGLASNRAYRKCAEIRRRSLGNYHPHGDGPIYDRSCGSRRTSYRYPLVDGQGFGLMVAIRRRPCVIRRRVRKRSPTTQGHRQGTVQLRSGLRREHRRADHPSHELAQSSVNGSAGIGFGMADECAPAQSAEVIDAVIATVELRGQSCYARLKAVLMAVPGLDFPSGYSIVGRQGISSRPTGRGAITLRARAAVEDSRRARSSRSSSRRFHIRLTRRA